MTFEYAFFLLLALMMAREVFLMRQIQKLLDRAMSRSYHEYQIAENYKPREPQPKLEDEMPEDLGILQGIG